jgi:DNA polymerase elongation subunit (family B)
MNEAKTRVSNEVIEAFLSGTNPKKYVVGIEAGYNEPYASLIINDPQTGKRIEKQKYKPFLWFKHDVVSLIYGGKKLKQIEAAKKYGIKTKKLRNYDDNGVVPTRLQNGYRYLATCEKSYNDLVSFFKEGGVDVFDKTTSKLFFMFTPVEQFMIQTGIRMFKGFDDYNDLHRFQFDLETEGLSGNRDAIFQIGIRDNRGFEYVLETKGATAQERRDSERENIIKFFEIINRLGPDVITGYNSESFDWKFFFDRCERLSLNIGEIAIGLDGKTKIKRKPSVLKLGNEMEAFEQTYIFGFNVIDIAHSVRRAQAINSDIKSWGLKYITQFSGVAKQNRVYVPGDKIHATWSDTKNDYAYNDTNGDWYKISERMPLKDGYVSVKGDYIVKRYLLDDLWETEQIDTIFNQAAFLISKILPTTYSRSSTMGTATQWKLIMSAWSYENGLAIPETESKRDFTGGLSRLLQLGYARGVVKLDYAALYPKTQLTHEIFPDLDISGVMEGLLTYIVDTRDKFKFLTTEHKDKSKSILKDIEKNGSTYSPEKLKQLKKELAEHKSLSGLYDKKQLPLKILANSWFGAYGAPYIFNWGDSDCAEETTCRGRQYLRLMVRHFCEKYGFVALVGDTDGFNFAFPENIDTVKYLAKGSHWKTEKFANQELIGLEAVLAEFNETYMMGRMGLDIDDICNSTINFSRKNYANDINGKIKLVGNSIKSKKMPAYIEDFLNKAIRLLLDGKGKDFINFYYEYVDKIYNYNIPMVKIASKSKVKTSISDYRKKASKKNKAGNPMPKQAHMELAMNAGLDVKLGDVIYYVNTGTAKSHGDLKTIKKENGIVEVQLNCKLIDGAIVDSNLELIREIDSLHKMLSSLDESEVEKRKEIELKISEMDESLLKEEYNVARYLDAFNKKVKPLLVCFHSDIRHDILLSIKKDRKTKLEKLTDRHIFTESQSQLVSGMPDDPKDQDTYEELMTMEDKEIKFWDKVDMVPNNMEEEEWSRIRVDYHERKRIEKENGIKFEVEKLDDIFKRLELEDLRRIESSLTLPDEIIMFVTINDNGMFVSRKWEVELCPINDLFKYEEDAIERNKWYQLNNNTSFERYEQWLDYKSEQMIMTINLALEDLKNKNIHKSIDLLKKKIEEFEHKNVVQKPQSEELDMEDEDEDEYNPEAPESEVDGFIPELQRADFEVEITNYTPIQEHKEEKDEWNF